jgi:hypothetical protein
MPAAVQRSVIAAFRRRFTLRTDATHRPHHVLDRVGAGERAPQLCRQLQAIDSHDLVVSPEDAGGNTRRLLVEPAGEIAQRSFGLVGIVQFPSLLERAAHRGMQRAWAASPSQRALWIWHRWIGVWAPKVRRMTLLSALALSTMNRRNLRVEPGLDQIVDERLLSLR